MSIWDDDDDVRRNESDELHGIAGGWYDKDPTPPHGTERPLFEVVGTYIHRDDRIPTGNLGIAQVWPDSYRYVPVPSATRDTVPGVQS